MRQSKFHRDIPNDMKIMKENKMSEVKDAYGNVIKNATTMRFSKAKVWANVEERQNRTAEKFETVEGKKYDEENGTNQCATKEGLILHEQWVMLEHLAQDITQQWG